MKRTTLHYYTGEVRQALSGYAADCEITKNAASGGVVTGLLCGMLRRGEIDGALVYRLKTNGGTFDVEPFIARSRAELISAQGSIYFAFSPFRNDALDMLRAFPGKIAVVGLPCSLAALKKIIAADSVLQEKIVLTVGLFCGGTSRPGLLQQVLARKGIPIEQVTEFHFRRGLWRGHSEAYLRNGELLSWPAAYYKLYQNLFICSHSPCLSCFDHFAEAADLSCGDVWLLKHRNDKVKHSAIAARSTAGVQAVANARKAGELLLTEEPLEMLYRANKRAVVYHKAIRARAFAGRFCGVKIRIPAEARRMRWNELLAALMIVPLYRFSIRRPDAVLKIPRRLLKCYLYVFKGLTNF